MLLIGTVASCSTTTEGRPTAGWTGSATTTAPLPTTHAAPTQADTADPTTTVEAAPGEPVPCSKDEFAGRCFPMTLDQFGTALQDKTDIKCWVNEKRLSCRQSEKDGTLSLLGEVTAYKSYDDRKRIDRVTVSGVTRGPNGGSDEDYVRDITEQSMQKVLPILFPKRTGQVAVEVTKLVEQQLADCDPNPTSPPQAHGYEVTCAIPTKWVVTEDAGDMTTWTFDVTIGMARRTQ